MADVSMPTDANELSFMRLDDKQIFKSCDDAIVNTFTSLNDMVRAAIRLCHGESDDVLLDNCVRKAMNSFIYGVWSDDVELNIMYLKSFASRSVVDALSMLYLSPVKDNKELGRDMIKQFIADIGHLPRSVCAYAAPLVHMLCTRLRTADPSDWLYYDCRDKFCSLIDTIYSVDLVQPHMVSELVSWKDIFLYVIEIGNQLLDVFTCSLKSPSSLTPTIKVISCFKVVLKVVLDHIFNTVNLKDPIRMPDGALGHPFCKELQSLYMLFSELLSKTDLFFRSTEHNLSMKNSGESIFKDVDVDYFCLLRALNEISKIFYGARENFREMLERSKKTLRCLVMTYGKTDCVNISYVDWMLEHKEILGFECRRTLALMMLINYDEEVEYVDEDDECEMLIDRSNLLAESFRYITQTDPPTLCAGLSIQFINEEVEYVDEDDECEMLIDRSNLLAESFRYITQTDPPTLCAGLSIQFINEEATGPGVMREWFLLVFKEIFSTKNTLFISNPNDHTRFYINPASKRERKHLDYFWFCGRIIALALMHEVQVGIVFDRVLFMQLAGFVVKLEHIKDTDPTLYHSCKQILDMDADLVDSDILGLTFITEYEEFGSRKVVEMVPGGGSLKVNSANRLDYVNALIRWRFHEFTRRQVAHFAKGFQDIMSCTEYMSFFFDCLELEDLDQMLRGSESDLSTEDWKSHTDNIGYTNNDPQIIWFWKVVDEMSPEQQRHLLFFWTSVKYLPFEGFSGLSDRLKINKAQGTINHLPSSHTCYNQLCLPEYPTYEMMHQRIGVIVQEHIVSSFGNL